MKDKYFCEVTFRIQNNSYNFLDCNVSIRGQERVGGQKTASLKMVGEKYMQIELSSKESLKVREVLEVSRKPDIFQINTW